MNLIPYSIEERESSIALDQFVENYVDKQACTAACKACNKYGKNWTCPPFDFETTDLLAGFTTMTVICSKISLMRNAIGPVPTSSYPDYIKDTYGLVKLVVEDKLLAREKLEEGSRALFPGSCMRCPHECKRAEGLPCVSPNTLRYSLEALGGMLSPLVADLFHEEFCWAGPDELPEYFLMVSALLQK